jgi:predicted dehydrogenase/nucleoside-diphosphate-sugar epimerase
LNESVAAIADPSREARNRLAELAPQARGFESIAELLAEEPVNVVHVCTPPETHEYVANQALSADCHTYVEKPFALTAEEASSLTSLATEKARVICAGHQLLFTRPAREAEELMKSLGSVLHVESFFTFRQVRGASSMSAVEQLIDILPHPVYLLLHFLEAASPGTTHTQIETVQLGHEGTVHALLRRGELTGVLVASLAGRPIESYVRVTGSHGTLQADFVRNSLQHLIGPGVSAIDKLLNPYRWSRQLAVGSTAAIYRRLARSHGTYQGLSELLSSFYHACGGASPPPLTLPHIVDTVSVCERLAKSLTYDPPRRRILVPADNKNTVVVTGGSGYLGSHVARRLVELGFAVRVLTRRQPPPWAIKPGVQYSEVDLSGPVPSATLKGSTAIIHCAAETVGDWDDHQRNSVDATETVCRLASAAGLRRVVHVSSLAVLATENGKPLCETSPLKSGRGAGPYVWGKAESERVAASLCVELGLDLCIVRPGALIDKSVFIPPGRLGRRIGNLFVAVGNPSDTLNVIDVEVAARIIVDLAVANGTIKHLNLVHPKPATRRKLIRRLKSQNPQIRIIWLPRLLLVPMSFSAKALQRLLRPRKEPLDVASAFASTRCDTRRMTDFLEEFERRASSNSAGR